MRRRTFPRNTELCDVTACILVDLEYTASGPTYFVAYHNKICMSYNVLINKKAYKFQN
jgi:hypothetical protein